MEHTAHDHYNAALSIRDAIMARRFNEPEIKMWAAVVRECTKAESKFYDENKGRVHGRSHQSFLSNLDRIRWIASAKMETLTKGGS